MPVYQLPQEPVFPDPEEAQPSGLLAVGGDLSAQRLVQAYAHGIFPWFSKGDPILWWSPDPRMVLYPDKLKLSKSLLRNIRNGGFRVSFDTDFRAVIEACARVPRNDQDGTWITPEMVQAYIRLHESGIAHSVEVTRNNKLVGGLYGLSLGKAFFGESMFYLERDASKIALYFLVERLKAWAFSFIDAQMETEHLKRLGAQAIARHAFLEQLAAALEHPTKRGKW